MRSLGKNESRLVAIGILLLIVALGWFALARPLIGGFFDRAAERQRLELQLQRDARIQAALPVWRAAARAQAISAPRFTITAPSEELAVESLKDRLAHLASDEGFSFTDIQDLQADARAGTVRVRADMTLNPTQFDGYAKTTRKQRAHSSLSTIYQSRRSEPSLQAASGRWTFASIFQQTGGRAVGDPPELAPFIASGVLAVALVLQFTLPADRAVPTPLVLTARRARPVTIPPLADYPTILSAPLFAPDRNPGPAGTTGGGGVVLGGYAVVGAGVGRGVGTAVVSTPGGKVDTLRLGDTIADWTLVAVDSTKATFERKGVRHILVIGEPAEVVSQAAGGEQAAPDQP